MILATPRVKENATRRPGPAARRQFFSILECKKVNKCCSKNMDIDVAHILVSAKWINVNISNSYIDPALNSSNKY